MGKHIGNGQSCFTCKSSDGMFEYEKTYHCFSCGETFRKIDQSPSMKYESKPEESDIKKPELPMDFSYHIPRKVLEQLLKYYFTPELLKKYRVGWSNNCWMWSRRQKRYNNHGARLIIPSYSGRELEFYEAKTFCKYMRQKRKYVTCGDKQLLFYSKGDWKDDCIVLVEDMLSAMRVGELYPTISLRGTNLTRKNLLKLAKINKPVILWLDGDGPGQRAAAKIKSQLLSVGLTVSNILSEYDPKGYPNDKIKKLIEGVKICQ